MRILFLSNGAPNYHRFYNPLAETFRENGDHVVFAVDGPFSRDLNGLDRIGAPVHDFSTFWEEYSKAGRTDAAPGIGSTNRLLLSDFERSEIYRLGEGRSASYYESLGRALLAFFDELIRAERIDAVLYEDVSNAFAYAAFEVCRMQGVPYVAIGPSRLPGRWGLIEPMGSSERLSRMVGGVLDGSIAVPGHVWDWVDAYLGSIDHVVPDYMRYGSLDDFSLLKRYASKAKRDRARVVLRHCFRDSTFQFQVGNPARLSYEMVRRNVLRRMRIWALRHYYSRPAKSDRYLVYFLHYHPEASTSVLASAFLNEFEVVRNIAFSLPAGMLLYVKDHVSAYGHPSMAFYRKLRSLPGVRVLGPREDTKAIIRGSEAVLTLTSTAGYEALLLGKKVFLFGTTFYSCHPNVVKVKELGLLPETLAREVSPPTVAPGEYNRAFVAAYYLCTEEGVLDFTTDEQSVASLARTMYPTIAEAIRVRVRQRTPEASG